MGFGGQDGGYATFVFNKYGKELAQKYTSRLRNKDDILCAKAICGTQSARWEGQTFYLIFDVQYADAKQGVVTETVRFIGRRVWFDTYKWGAGIAVHAKWIWREQKRFCSVGRQKSHLQKIKNFLRITCPHFE